MALRTASATFAASALFLAPALATAQEANETFLPAVSIYGSEPATPSASNPGPDVVRLRGGIGFFNLGFAASDQFGGGGVGVGAHLGVQVNRLIGVYANLRLHSILISGDAELDAIVDFTLRDRVQLGAGIGGYVAYTVFSYGSAPAGVVFPFHFGVTPALWRGADGRRHGFHITLDLAPGFSPDRYGYGGVRTAGSVQLGMGWEWY